MDDFNGNNAKLVECINALLSMDAAGSLRPHGVGGHGRKLLQAAASRLEALSHAAGQDGEQCRAASVASSAEDCASILEHHAAKWDITKLPVGGDLALLILRANEAAELLRALSRGVPEDGRIPSDEAIARAFRDACAADLQHTGRRHKELQRIYDAAIAAQQPILGVTGGTDEGWGS